ncbi:putative oxidoreductase [Yersinia similis]|uniref:Putative oxidoreductase n=1 Tax=Yersinia similis TaxID=367190 RepID=A0A0T9QZF8_9GAMM|nr:putative oxidoreductase [Yersinia similis]CNF98583.1 putative oxidoreductase [Yersinia similis]CNI35734.1 putative oxidoreductase [Yersinia similis]
MGKGREEGAMVIVCSATVHKYFGPNITSVDEECFELERNYTPCDVINDYTAGKRIAREVRPPSGIFAP